jgi:hypothetical protein
MHSTRLIILLMCVSVVLLISACMTPPQATQSPLQQPNAATSSPVATPTTEPKPPALKIEKPGTATVGGRLLRLNNTPIKNTTVYVAAIENTTGAKLASIDPVVAPHVDTDANGYFVFSDLTPGQYALIMSTPRGLILPETGDKKSVTLAAQADQATDIGSVAIGYEYPDN